MHTDQAWPPISIVISTRDRAGDIPKAVASILAADYPSFEICVVDQSRGDATEQALAPFAGDPRLVYRRSRLTGLSHGRNEGIAATNHELIAMTDDDCIVTSDWLRHLARTFTLNPRVGVVYGNVTAPPHDGAVDYIPTFVQTEAVIIRTVEERPLDFGIGACMGLRRACWEAVAGFDEFLGAGAPFRAAEDSDIATRALLRDFHVATQPGFAVVHYGRRPWQPTGRRLFADGVFGIGAASAKLLKAGAWPTLPLIWKQWGVGHFVGNLVRRRRPLGVVRVNWFLRGFCAGIVRPVDRRTIRFSTKDALRRV